MLLVHSTLILILLLIQFHLDPHAGPQPFLHISSVKHHPVDVGSLLHLCSLHLYNIFHIHHCILVWDPEGKYMMHLLFIHTHTHAYFNYISFPPMFFMTNIKLFLCDLQQSSTLRSMAQLIVNVTVRRATGGDSEWLLTSPKHLGSLEYLHAS